MRHRVRNHQLAQPAPVDLCARRAAEDAVGDDRHHLLGAVRHEHVRGFDERAARVGHVVDEDRDAPVDVADERHARDFVGLRALFVDQREVEVEAVGERCGAFGAAGVRGDDDGVFVVEVFADVAEGCGFGVEAGRVSGGWGLGVGSWS